MTMLLCAHVRSFALALARRDHPEYKMDALLLADAPDRGRVLDCDAGAYALGARIGQTVVQARAAAGEAHVIVADPACTRATWNDMLDALDGVSPLVDDAGEGLAYLEMRGIPGTAPEWIAAVHAALRPFEVPVRVAIGPNKFVARAATYTETAMVCDEKSAAQAVAPLPLDVLAIESKAIERFNLLGVRVLGDLAALPHGPLVRRFGSAAAAWHAHANGLDDTPFLPRAHELHVEATLYGEGSASAAEQVLFALRVLADRVCADLARLGKGACQLEIRFECENGDLHDLPVGLAQATADPRPVIDVVRAKLERLSFAAPVCGLRMRAVRFEEIGTDVGLFARNAFDPQAVAVALARLEATLGEGALRARLQPSPCVEARFAYDPFPAPAAALPIASCAMPHNPVPQLRLLAVREIDVRLRDNAPVRVGAQAVRDCAGPWRVDDGWFENPVARDEYDVWLEDGALYRIYRQGETWYVRGAYD